MPFHHLLVSLLGVKMTSADGGKPKRPSWSPFHVKLGEIHIYMNQLHVLTSLKAFRVVSVSWISLERGWYCLEVDVSFSSHSTKPTVEEIKQWAQSFDKLMKNPAGRNKFREFLRTEYSEENMLFWLACEDLKKEMNKSCIEEKARLIYEDYISILSPKEVCH